MKVDRNLCMSVNCRQRYYPSNRLGPASFTTGGKSKRAENVGQPFGSSSSKPTFFLDFNFLYHNYFPESILQLLTTNAAFRDSLYSVLSSSACLILYPKHSLEMLRSSTYQMEGISRQSLDSSDVHDPSVDADVPMSPGQPSQHRERDQRSSYALDARTLTVWWGFEFLTWMLATLSTVIILKILAIFRKEPVSHCTPTSHSTRL